MQLAQMSLDEAARLALLNAINIFDSDPESHFDRITALAARLLGTPISLVSLIDHERQWFKSRYGLAAAETPRDSAFCAHAILRSETLVVADATKDPRFHDNPLVTGAPYIRFYAGVPLQSIDGVALGTLCVIDVEPRQMKPGEEALLRDLAAVVSRELAYRELAARGQGNLLFQLRVPAGDGPCCFTFSTNDLAELLGVTQTALLGNADLFFDQLHPLDQPLLARGLRRRIDAPTETGFVLKFRLLQPGRRKPLWLEMRVAQRHLNCGSLQWTGSLVDVSLEREVEFQQRETDRLRTAAALVAGVAHDFNNILGSMIGLAELCRDQTEPGTRLNRNLDTIHSSGRRAASLIRQMLDYARQSPLDVRPSLLALAIEALLPLVRVGLPRDVTVELQVKDDARVLIDTQQIEQVVHNLVRNAGDAMKATGGVVRITLDSRVAALSPLEVASVRLTVADSGCGIGAGDIGRVFDPFFTTKAVGEGTGLGLSSAQGIVVAHGGIIEIESTLGKGSTFNVWLPSMVATKVASAALQLATRTAPVVSEDPAPPAPSLIEVHPV